MTLSTKLMRCGCAAQGFRVDEDGGKTECCITHGCTEPAPEPDLSGRYAVCALGGTHGRVPSSLSLAFFEYRPDREVDTYYCGCFGWD